MNVSEPLLRDREIPFGSGVVRRQPARVGGPESYPDYRKGTRLIFRGREVDARQRKWARRRRRRSREELSFLVNSDCFAYPGIGLPGDGVEALVKHVGFPRVWCAADGP